MRLQFNGKRIEGILTVLPSFECSFEDALNDDAIKRARRLSRIMGFGRRRRVKGDTLISDMHIKGVQYLLEHEYVKKEEIGAIVVITLTQDYLTPSVSSLIHGKFGFDEEVLCVDIAQGCAGYIVGLIESFSLLEGMPQKKILLCTGDVLNRIHDNEVKVNEPIFGGDAATISVVSSDDEGEDIIGEFFTNGTEGKNLIMPAGGFAHPVYSADDAMMDDNGEKRNGLGIWMDGSNVFNFILRDVPPMIEVNCRDAGCDISDIELFLLHQPNRFILEKLADKMGVPRELVPMNTVEKYGNSNSSTIPVTITDSVADVLLKTKKFCCLAGFGSGLTWSSLLMHIGNMSFCEMVTMDI